MVLLVLGMLLFYVVIFVCIICGLMIEILNSNFICIVCVKGLSYGYIVVKYVLKFVLLFVVFYMGFVFVGIIIGLVVIEIIFGLFGIGKFFVNVVFN